MLCDCQGQVIKGDRVFSWLSLSLSGHLPLEPPCYEEAQSHGEAHVERNQGPGPSTPTELPANSLHQLASHVSEASWKWIDQKIYYLLFREVFACSEPVTDNMHILSIIVKLGNLSLSFLLSLSCNRHLQYCQTFVSNKPRNSDKLYFV